MRSPIRFICIALLGLTTAALVSCSAGSSKNLIPIQNAGPLQSDFEAVARDAQQGSGSCTTTEAALSKTEQDFAQLPSTVDHGLRTRLKEGISNLRARSLALCVQPLAQSTSTESLTNSTSTQSTTTTNTETQPSTTPTQTTPTDTGPSTTTTPPGPEGGTPAPGTPGNTAPGVTPANEHPNDAGNGAGGTGAGNSGGQGGGQ